MMQTQGLQPRPFDGPQADTSDALGEADLLKTLRTRGGRAPRPKDAATLILYRGHGIAARILMGRRASGHDFMPDKYVFPGGRVDAGDGSAPSATELADSEQDLLRVRSRRRPRAFALTCVRETFEETGLIVGAAAAPASKAPPNWAPFVAAGALANLSPLTFIGRAITPPLRHKRFDARFFMADADIALVDDRPPADGRELKDLRWFTFAEARSLDLPNVTRFVLGEVENRLVAGQALSPFMLQWTHQGHRQERITPGML
jgi:8-oxo-dGTP pyrophosphatase MutT (NUDIX family)